MVDDYSFPDPTFSYLDFIENLEKSGYGLDFSLRESQLIEDCDTVISLIDDENLKLEIVSYIKTKKKYPCSLFIATWYLLRLGKVSSKLYPEELVADKLINILPDSFKPFEEKGFEIIKNTKFSECSDNIENKYFKGRNI